MSLPDLPLGSFGPDEILSAPFGAGLEIDEAAFPLPARRERPITFPPDAPVAGTAAFDPMGAFEREAEPLFRLHPYQFGTSREEAFQFIAEYRTLLLQLTGYEVTGGPAARRPEIFDQLIELFEGRIVRVLTRMEAAFDKAPAVVVSDEGEIEDLGAFGVNNVVLVSPTVVEVLGAQLPALLREIRRTEAVVGVAVADLRWFAAGFAPAKRGFDFSVVDLSPFLPEGGEHYVPLFADGVVPTERVARIGDIHWLSSLDVAARIDTQLRRLGAAGLRRLAVEAAVRSVYLRTQLRRHDPGLCLGGGLLDTFVRGMPPVRIDSSETKSDLDGLAAQISVCQ